MHCHDLCIRTNKQFNISLISIMFKGSVGPQGLKGNRVRELIFVIGLQSLV